MLKLTATLLFLAGCFVAPEEVYAPKSLAHVIEEQCNKPPEYEYLRFELEGEGKRKGKSLVFNFRVEKNGLENCHLTEAVACLDGSDKTVELRSAPNRDSRYHSPNSYLESAPVNGKIDSLTVLCDGESGLSLSYQSGIKIYKMTPKSVGIDASDASVFNFKEHETTVRSGKFGNITFPAEGARLESYQDSQCFPESTSSCEAGSGQ